MGIKKRLAETIHDPTGRGALTEQLASDPRTHVIWKQFLGTAPNSRAFTLCARSEACRRATRTIFALHREYRRTRQWPASLRATPLLTAPWRTDPFSRKDFIYRRTEDGFTLYSVSTNGNDDGGRHNRSWHDNPASRNEAARLGKSDYVFWPVQKRNAGR